MKRIRASLKRMRRSAVAAIALALVLGGSLRSASADGICQDELIVRFGERKEIALTEPVARALVFKGERLSQLTRFEDAIAVYDDVDARFGEREEVALRRYLSLRVGP